MILFGVVRVIIMVQFSITIIIVTYSYYNIGTESSDGEKAVDIYYTLDLIITVRYLNNKPFDRSSRGA